MGDFVEVVTVFFEELDARPTADEFAGVNFVIPVDLKFESLTRAECFRKVDSHHGVDNRVLEFGVGLYILAFRDVESAIENFTSHQALHRCDRNSIKAQTPASETVCRPATVCRRVRTKDVSVKLQPEIFQFVRAVIGVANFF